jgi:regulator of replication initiation timing
MEDDMKRKPIRVLHYLRSRGGNALAEFTVTTAMMATLAATAAPKLSDGPKTNTMMSIREAADLNKEVRQLNQQRDHLKEEIFELLVAQNELLMQNVENSHLRNTALNYSSAIRDLQEMDSYNYESNSYSEDTIYQYRSIDE